eukprot:gene48348-65602_t
MRFYFSAALVALITALGPMPSAHAATEAQTILAASDA